MSKEMTNKIKVVLSQTYEFQYNENSPAFKKALENYTEFICDDGIEGMFEHIAQNFMNCENNEPEGVGDIETEHKQGTTGIKVIDSYPNPDYATTIIT